MTLGGLALAVGILVDDATVEIENINRNLAMGKTGHARDPRRRAADRHAGLRLDAVHLHRLRAGRLHHRRRAGTSSRRSRSAVVFAMLASYFLSRTVVPTMVQYLLPAEAHLHQPGHPAVDGGRIWSVHQRFNRHFERFQGAYRGALAWALRHTAGRRRRLRGPVGGCRSASSRCSAWTSSPPSTPGSSACTCAAPPARASRRPRRRFAEVEAVIRETIPADEIEMIIDNIGIPGGGINLAFSDASIVSAADGEILVALNPEHHAPDARLRRPPAHDPARAVSRSRCSSSSRPTSSTQILNFGLPAPIDVQIVGRDPKNLEIARDLVRRIAPGPRRRRRPPAAGRRRADYRRRRGPPAGAGSSASRSANVATSLLVSLSGIVADRAELLAQPAERRELPRRRADAAVPHRLDRTR